MNEIIFKLSKENFDVLKKVQEIIAQNILIKTDENKNIIIVFLDYYQQLKSPRSRDYIVLTTDYKSEVDFIVFKRKTTIITNYYFNRKFKQWMNKKTKNISPIFIPPIDEYEVTILLKENILKMKSKSLKFEFPLDDPLEFILEKVEQEKNTQLVESIENEVNTQYLTLNKNHLPN
jgi:hypothetical protein